MSFVKLDIPADTLRNDIVAGLYARRSIPEHLNVLDIKFGELNHKTGMVSVELKSQKEKEVQVIVTRPK